jgi:hypothetical protein
MLDVIQHFFVLAASNIDPSCNAVICSSNTALPNSTGDIGSGVGKIMKALFTVMGSIAVIVVMFGGIKYVISSGDPKKTAEAKETILYAVIGIVISLSAYAIVSFIANGLGK